jgi:methyl-accepting chemotaxis protein
VFGLRPCIFRMFSLGIEKKILAGVSILIAGYLASSGWGFFSGARDEAALQRIAAEHFPKATQSKEALFTFSEATKLATDGMMTGDSDLVTTAVERGTRVVKVLRSLSEDSDRFGVSSADLTALVKQLEQINAETSELFKALGAQTEENKTQVQARAQQFTELNNNARAKLSRVADQFAEALNQALMEISVRTHRSRYLNVFVCGGVILLGFTAVWVVTNRSVTRPVRQVMAGLNESSGRVASVSQEMVETLNEASASLEEVANAARQNSGNVQSGKQASQRTLQAAEQGVTSMNTMKSTLRSVHTAADDLRGAMDELQKSGKAISSIIKTIDEIAFQTNLLALNAAVEAARAGDAGLGFAVVANEVRSLAQRSTVAAKETAELIAASVGSSHRGTETSARVFSGVQAVLQESGRVDENLAEIVTKVREVDHLVEEIEQASVAQSADIERISTAVSSLEGGKSGNQDSAAVQVLRHQAGELENLVGGLEVLVNGRARRSAAETQAS